MGRARALALLAILTITSFAMPVFAIGDAPTTEWKLSGTVNTENKISAGDVVTYTYKIENTGDTTSYVDAPIYAFTPAEFTYSNYATTSLFPCFYHDRYTPEMADKATYAIGRELNYCGPNLEAGFINLDPGETYSFDIVGIANANYTIDSESYALYFDAVSQSARDAWYNGENIWLSMASPGVNVTGYPYGVNQSQTPLGTTPALVPSRNGSSNVLSDTIQSQTSELSSSSEVGEVSDDADPQEPKVKKSPLTKKDKKIAEIGKDNNSGVRMSLANYIIEHKYQIATATVATISLLLSGIIFVRRARRRTQIQREYRRALTLLKDKHDDINRTITKTHEPAVQETSTIQRRKIHAKPVEMDSGQKIAR